MLPSKIQNSKFRISPFAPSTPSTSQPNSVENHKSDNLNQQTTRLCLLNTGGEASLAFFGCFPGGVLFGCEDEAPVGYTNASQGIPECLHCAIAPFLKKNPISEKKCVPLQCDMIGYFCSNHRKSTKYQSIIHAFYVTFLKKITCQI